MAEIPDWYAEFAAAVVAALPRDIDENAARAWTLDPDNLRYALTALATAAGIGPLRNDKSEEGWELVRDVTEPETIAVDQLQMGSFGDGIEDLIGEPMVELVLGMEGLLGQRHAEYVLDRQGDLPEEFQRYALVFPGTVWKSQDQNHQVPCLVYRSGEWALIFGILEGGFDNRDRIAELAAT